MSDIVYLKHPVSAGDKAKYRAEGKRIVDAVYAPEDAELSEVKAQPRKTRGKTEKDEE